MKITDLLSVGAVDLNVTASSKEELLKKAVELMVRQGNITDKEQYLKAVFAREEEGTTGVGDGIAIPHGRCEGVSQPGLIAMVIPKGVDYDALDDEPVDLLFLIAANPKSGSAHIDILSKLSGMLMNDDFTAALKAAKSPQEFLKVIDDAENEKDAKTQAPKEEAKKGQVKLLAVTGCPTGIAHTFMAAEALEKTAKAKGCFIKVETRGSGGAKNVLTEEEIREADCIIVAADTKVPMDRFDGKKLLEVPVSDGISKAENLIDAAMNGQASLYHGNGASASDEAKTGGSVGHQIYKHLMNGVSHMLPFVVGGGILIAIAFLIDGLMVDLNNIPQALIDQYGSADAVKSNFGTLTQAAALFKGIGGTAFSFMLPVLAGFIAMSIADRPGLAVGFVGGAIAANGTSGFLGALAAGFIAGYLVKLLMKLCENLPKSLDGVKPVLIYPLVGTLGIGLVMNFVIEPVIGVINTALNNGLASMNGASSIILGLVLGGMMAIDMGGPFNKAAYVFGTASIAAGNYNIMAAVMIGGMVPPCAIALATLLFKNKFTEQERKSGPTNFIMGLAFITEGAIPFAASDPLRVLPSCIVGSALAGALSMAFNCTLMAPHGGIFVFPVVGNAIMYLVALIAGTVASAFLLGLLKKDVH
ncbi:MAG: fructose-specific PTS transporter subunit EIIC [Lachnospiraceae bacterium]|nr:fructose-specific PTS transporter subunit EIIC [Lachnospiraceae bacterium]